jgi:hypothetical protein
VPKLFLRDTTVLINFAIIRRMDLLAELLKGQGSWCLSIARECSRSQAYHPDLDQAGAIFGTPLIADRREIIDARTLREAMASPGEPATKHLGEAETVAIISARQLDGLFLTDDRDAVSLAHRHHITALRVGRCIGCGTSRWCLYTPGQAMIIGGGAGLSNQYTKPGHGQLTAESRILVPSIDSTARAAASRAMSVPAGDDNWSPIGRPSPLQPHGRTSAGAPVRL